MFDSRGALAHLDSARDELTAERKAVAHKLVAAGKFALARMAELGNSHEDWIVDDWELVAAELGVELGISRGRACTQITHGRDLIQRLPEFAKVFLTGAVDLRVFLAIFHRTALITDPDIMAVIDAQVAAAAPSWNALSDDRITELVDWMILDVDPDAVRRARQSRRNRYISVEPIGDGMVEIHGRVDAVKGALFDQRLDALARTVCPDDPRTLDERRADAVEPLSLGANSIACLCGKDTCPAAGDDAVRGQIVIHVLAEQGTVTGESDRPALLPGYGAVPAEQIQEMVPHAHVRPVPAAAELDTENGYQPSRKLTDFVRCRDLACRWPGCHAPVARCDIDHTAPWPYGPTHPSNTKLYCRIHHLIKTFHCGPGGWTDRQHADGTVTITAPSGRTYTTAPGGKLFFPQLDTPTATLVLPPDPPPSPHRELAVPKRTRTRAQNRAYRIAHERALNRAHYGADPPPF
ncbi:HNH endonuclease signature motif containing protein [Mycolicibacterium diernhoferi]|uniref:HNH endonuclease n=1 Tax=Mycolicibacterium diernhoferi TaxID=1801 RepID=A0A1Q4H5P9_9MYCO|nr:HNH endonuclease signature motif containing protein [Mycolicibacterium diernhoferi]OJZ62889.1 hypothetical protein BRW64_24575 [Mycolicibacterium diernhoferi]OPE53628.1 HNH endonuclease [Mycolicibacterium diernhoferi]PEG54707.1 HNH endonuclease [Mycolicibacterium diernhoferi]QYL22929.1 HNH endonuclease [Mycolicibacterium diernhoferi]